MNRRIIFAKNSLKKDLQLLNNRTFQQSLINLTPNCQVEKFLLAVSGGVDSMVLLRLFYDANLSFEVAHVNYRLRAEHSQADQALVEEFCATHDIKFHLYTVSDSDQKPENSIQEWARNLRYTFFSKIKKENNITNIVTAHHLNDQLETFIINLSKAAGLKGLTGISSGENEILRPLLAYSKEAIYDFAKENNIAFREDLSNLKNDYLRNFIRNEITPLLEKVNPDFLENFGKSLNYLHESKSFQESNILAIERLISTEKDGATFLDKEMLFSQSDFVQFEILRKFGFKNRTEIEKIKISEIGKFFISSEYQLFIDRKHLMITNLDDTIAFSEEEVILTLSIDNKIILPENVENEIRPFGNCNWKFDKSELNFPLKLRRRKSHDVFYPTKMAGKKKISKFFKDEKLPILAQQKIWILCDAKDQIMGILPLRQDRRFILKKNSEAIVIKI